jgi:CDP-glucose 4,6-dehydratase
MKNSFWCDRPTLVTGATGLLGSWLVPRLLDASASVVCIIRDWIPQSHLVSGNANRNPASTFETNIAGTWRLLEACRRSPTVQQIVIASSDKAYGAQETLPYEETFALRAVHPYDVSKACSDLLAQSYAHTFDLPVVVTRCGNLFGGGDLNWNRIVPGTIRAVLRGQRPVIRSDGQLVRDYFYVEDCAAAYMLLAEKLAANHGLRGESFNFSAEQPLTVLEMVDTILRVMSSDVQPEVCDTADYEIGEQYLSARKARNELEWEPLFTLEEGIELTASWYRGMVGGGVPTK